VILVDSNLLIYAASAASPHHAPSREWLEARLTEPARVGLPWSSVLSFLRVVTHPRIYQKPATVMQAWSIVDGWLNCPNVWIPLPTGRHRAVLADVLAHAGRGANDVPDAHLAALAIEHGLTLCTADAGFARFPGLKWMNPISGRAAR
jgi:hypothetical protein